MSVNVIECSRFSRSNCVCLCAAVRCPSRLTRSTCSRRCRTQRRCCTASTTCDSRRRRHCRRLWHLAPCAWASNPSVSAGQTCTTCRRCALPASAHVGKIEVESVRSRLRVRRGFHVRISFILYSMKNPCLFALHPC